MTNETTNIPAGWENIFEPGEQILWQGRPKPGILLKPSSAFTTLFGLAFSGFALFWMIMASQAGGYFWTFGLIHFTAGLGVMLGPIFWPAYMRKRTWYTLTNRKAYVADITLLGQKRLRSYPITKDTPIERISGTYPTLYFAHEKKRGKNGTYEVPIGFERLTEADTVHGLIRTMQKDDT